MTPETTINGQPVSTPTGQTILEAAQHLGIEVPTLCHAGHLHPEGGCRMCLVHCEGHEKPLAACHTALQPGMHIETNTPEIVSLRRTMLSLYEQAGEVTGFSESAVRPGNFSDLLTNSPSPTEGSTVDDSHPYLRFRADACITCRLCLNACEQVQGQFVFGIEHRGPHARLVFGAGEEFSASPCVACGACVDVCPTGAISDRDRHGHREIGAQTETICGYCGVGCRIAVATKENRVLQIDPVADAAVNHGHLCAKGRYAHAWHHSKDRLTTPLLRVDGELRGASWDDALQFIADRLREIAAESGPESLGAFTSSRSTNEACYLLQKLFRAVLGSNNVDCCARVCHSSTALALQLVTGTGAATASYQDIERARLLVVAGANPTEAHPVVGARLKQAALNGVPLVVIDPRRIELAEYADFHLQLAPGTNVALFNGLAKVMLEDQRIDLAYLEARTEGLNELRQFLGSLDLNEIAAITKVPAKKIRAVAHLISAQAPALFVHGLGLSELMQGTSSVMTLCNLGMLTGSIGQPGAGMLPLRGQNNVQGSADMGSMPTHFTGYQALNDPKARARIKTIWGTLPPETPGLPTTIMLQKAAIGEQIRGLWLMGEDPVQSDPNETEVVRALKNLDLIIVQDLFLNESTKFAHVVLPSCGFLEQEGTFTNGERRIQHVRPAVAAPGDARPDWLAVTQVAERMGSPWPYSSPAEVMDEIAAVAPHMFGGVSYPRLTPDGLQWPCPEKEHPGTSTVHRDGFLRGKGKLVSIDYEASPEHGVEGFPYLLVTGRILEHYNVGTMTRRTPQAELAPRDELEINPIDAAREAIADGQSVTLTSRWGEIEVIARHSSRIAPETLFLSFHFPETHTNRVTGPTLDPQSKCPQYKATAVRIATGVGVRKRTGIAP